MIGYVGFSFMGSFLLLIDELWQNQFYSSFFIIKGNLKKYTNKQIEKTMTKVRQYGSFSSFNSCPFYSQSFDVDGLVRSVIKKMKYTCNNPHCRHRIDNHNRSGKNLNFNETGKFGSTRAIESSCQCYSSPVKNPEERNSPMKNCTKFSPVKNPDSPMRYYTKFSPQKAYNKSFYQSIPAGNYQREQERGRIINNSLHSGERMRRILYESQSPDARVQRGGFSKNYDVQYQISEERIKNTRAPSPEGKTKIHELVHRDRARRF